MTTKVMEIFGFSWLSTSVPHPEVGKTRIKHVVITMDVCIVFTLTFLALLGIFVWKAASANSPVNFLRRHSPVILASGRNEEGIYKHQKMFSQEDSRGFDLINHAIRMGSADVWRRNEILRRIGDSSSSGFATSHQHPTHVAAPHSGLVPPAVQSSNSFQFPWKLHDMLEQAQNDGLQEIVSWQDEGRSFKVYKPTIFVERLMPIYFKQTKYKSFQRQLNLYGFTRINEGPGKGGYKHKYFLKSNKSLCQYISRQSNEENVPVPLSSMHAAPSASNLRIQALPPDMSVSHSPPPDPVSPDSSTTGAIQDTSVDTSEKKEINEQYKALTQKDYQFPWKLHEMLEKSGVDNYDHIVSWQPGDYCFKVHDPTNFVTIVMPRFFKQTKYKSFQRQLNLYGFSRIDQGPNRGSYRHKLFLKGRKDLLSSMNRQKNTQSESRSQLMPQEVETRTTDVDNMHLQQPLMSESSAASSKPTPKSLLNEPKCIDCGVPELLACIKEDSETSSVSEDETPVSNGGGLNWRDPPSESFSDWVIVVLHNDTFHKESYNVHRRALAIGDRRSEYFARLFKSNTSIASNESVLVLGTAEAAVFPEVLDYVYFNVEPKLNMKKAFSVFKLAEHLEIQILRQLAIDFYSKSLNQDNVPVLLQVAPTFGDDVLINSAVQLYAQVIESLDVSEAGRLEPNLLLQVLRKSKTSGAEFVSDNSSRLVAECLDNNSGKVTPDLFRQLTDKLFIPTLDSLSAMKILAAESEIVKQYCTFVPDPSLHERCISSISEDWNMLRAKLKSSQSLGKKFKSISSELMFEILMSTTSSNEISGNSDVKMKQ